MEDVDPGYGSRMSDDSDLTVAGAHAAAERGALADWVARFLASPGSDNAALGERLRREIGEWHGPVELAFDRLHRLAGPPDQPTLVRLTDDDLDTVDDMEDSIEDGWTPPPLVVTVHDGQLVVEDGNHRIEGLRRAGFDRYPAVVGLDAADQRTAIGVEHAG